jgi:hypothetical protein
VLSFGVCLGFPGWREIERCRNDHAGRKRSSAIRAEQLVGAWMAFNKLLVHSLNDLSEVCQHARDLVGKAPRACNKLTAACEMAAAGCQTHINLQV